jgi:hypothetical protein
MNKYICGDCGMVRDRPFDHGYRTATADDPREKCGTNRWVDVTEVYRDGRAEALGRAALKVEEFFGLSGQECADEIREMQ